MRENVIKTYGDLEKLKKSSKSKIINIKYLLVLIILSLLSLSVSVLLVNENSHFFEAASSGSFSPIFMAVILEIFFTMFSIVKPMGKIEKIITCLFMILIFSFSVWISLSTVYSEFSKKDGIAESLVSEKKTIIKNMTQNGKDIRSWGSRGWIGNVRKTKLENAQMEKRLREIEITLASKSMGSKKERLNGLIIMVLIKLIFQLGNLLINRRIGKLIFNS